mgnify:CR=1
MKKLEQRGYISIKSLLICIIPACYLGYMKPIVLLFKVLQQKMKGS